MIHFDLTRPAYWINTHLDRNHQHHTLTDWAARYLQRHTDICDFCGEADVAYDRCRHAGCALQLVEQDIREAAEHLELLFGLMCTMYGCYQFLGTMAFEFCDGCYEDLVFNTTAADPHDPRDTAGLQKECSHCHESDCAGESSCEYLQFLQDNTGDGHTS
ncbi:MAG: hypothetical protein JWM37_90 [Candidatus Saccharibacteria bacterium]|nr:hypothetical protein [Candidatus Saccharibacteria bacterium]